MKMYSDFVSGKRRDAPFLYVVQVDPKITLATILFKNEVISLGRAAKLAGMYLVDFIEHISRLGIPVVDLTEEEIQQEIDVLNKWLSESNQI